MSQVINKLTVLPEKFAVCRLSPESEIPGWVDRNKFFSVTRTPDELSIVCLDRNIPDGIISEKDWRVLKVKGPLDFSLIGVLSSISEPLAASGIPVFVISTYDTDYVFVRENSLAHAITVLNNSGFFIENMNREKVKDSVLSVLKEIRQNSIAANFDHNRIANFDIRIGHVDGKKVKRFVVHFRSNGCVWCKHTGGCSMCGFWNETTQGKTIITAEEFVTQFKNVLSAHDLKSYASLSLYNAGSFLNEQEIPFSAAEEIFSLVSEKLPNLRQLIIESRVENISEEKLRALQKILGTDIRLSIGIGFESQNDVIRNLILNKGVSKRHFEKCIEITNALNIQPIAYLMIKPPFLTEAEAIEDAVESAKYLNKVGVREIHYETMTIEDNTFVNMLYDRGYYKLPWLWSIAEILKRVHPSVKPFLTPLSYIAKAKDAPKNCSLCSEAVKGKIYEKYCSDFSLSHFDELDCTCKQEWQKVIQEKSALPLEDKALKILSDL